MPRRYRDIHLLLFFGGLLGMPPCGNALPISPCIPATGICAPAMAIGAAPFLSVGILGAVGGFVIESEGCRW